MSDNFATLLAGARSSDIGALARLLTLCERDVAEVLRQKEVLQPKQFSLRLGITGPPGAGKSTLTGQLISAARAKGLKVAVIAVDPSSPFTHGAILADRVRYMEHTLDDGVFIRSLGTRGSLGGLSASAYLMARVFDLCEFDLVIIETVGVGQTELEIINVADRVVVTLVPESGDAIQAMKAGLLEIADLFVVNKSDRPGADALRNELLSSMQLAGESIEVLKTVATEGKGIDALVAKLFLPMTTEEKSSRVDAKRLQAEAKALLRSRLESKLDKTVSDVQKPDDILRLFQSVSI